MAKDSPKAKSETPFQRFERLTRKLVRVPKQKADKSQSRKGDSR